MYLDPEDVRPRSLFDRSPIDRRTIGFGVAAVVVAHLVAPLLAPVVVFLASIPYLGPGLVLGGLFVALVAMALRGATDERSGRAQAVGGATIAAGIHVVLPLMSLLVFFVAAAAGITLDAAPEPPPVIEDVVQARFVQLGEILDPHQLPDRQVPILRTDVPDPHVAPSLDPNPPPPAPRPDHEHQRDSVDDLMQRLSHDAQTFAEREEERVREGDPGGIEEGTERTATPGDLYQGRLYSFFRRGWSVPTTLSDEQVEGLSAMVIIEVHPDTSIGEWHLERLSGNGDFDESVRSQMTRVVTANPNIPPPPEEVAAQYLGQHIRVQFSGRQARR